MRVLVLGPLEIRDDNGVALPLSGSRLRTLIAVLALEAGRPVSTDRLIDCLYGDDLPQRAENALQLLVSRLRSALRGAGGGTGQRIATRSPGYALDVDADDVDALRFDRLVAAGRTSIEDGAAAEGARLLRQALDLWRGPALSDFAFDDFMAGPRARLEELRLAASEDCLEADLELGRHVACVGQAEQLVAAHPLRERAWRLLMLALYRSGRQADALRAFQQARHHLGEELGIEPGTELRDLEAAILAQDPSLTGPVPSRAGTTGAAPAAPPVPTGNLPRPLTGCIGRDDELAAVHALLESHRLVTLIGPGGTGKTRLAIEIGLARDHGVQATQAGADVWMIDLAAVADEHGVASVVRTVLGLNATAIGTAETSPVTADFGARSPLVVIDNCEHVIDEAARVAADLLTASPRLRILATSRESLGVPGEVLYSVPPLDSDAAARLFVERAEAATPDITFDDQAIAAVGAICVRLDGLPLAIELAAARVRTLHVSQIAARLDDRFRLLTTGPRTLLPRQRTLRAVVDWSYDLLDEAERQVFEVLSVFAGGATLEGVESVCACPDDVEPLLGRLVDKSLVIATRTPGGTRYGMLQTLANYAAERLAERGQGDAARRLHATWVLGLVRGAERCAGTAPTVTLAELDAEVENVDSALAWAQHADPAVAFDLAARLGWFWFWTGRIDRGWTTLAHCAESAKDAPDDLQARALAWAGMLGTIMQAEGATALVESAVFHGYASGHASSLAQALGIRAALAVLRGEPELAGPDLDAAIAGHAQSGDLHGQGMTWMVRGLAAMAQGRAAEARASYDQSVSFMLAAGDDWAAGVARHRIAQLDEAVPEATLAAVPAPVAAAMVRAQLASARSGSASGSTPGPTAATGSVAEALALAVADHIRGRVTLRSDRPADARPVLELALSRYRAQGNIAAVSTCLGDLGRMATAVGDAAGAVRFHAGATEAAMRSSDPAVVLSSLEGLSAALAATGDAERAGFALGAADVLREGGIQPWDPALDDRRSAETAAAALLGDDGLLQARVAGRTIEIPRLLDGLLG